MVDVVNTPALWDAPAAGSTGEESVAPVQALIVCAADESEGLIDARRYLLALSRRAKQPS
jgi:hypothetical protein